MKASLFLGSSLLALAGVLLACGGATTGGGAGGGGANAGNTVSGTVAGVTLSAASILAGIDSSSSSGPCTINSADGGLDCPGSTFNHGVTVLFTNHADATCATVRAGIAQNQDVEFANFAYLAVTVTVANGNVTPGTYPIVSPQSNGTGAQGVFSTTTATCAQALDIAATSGTVTLTTFDGASVAGTFDVTFGAQGSASGSFDQSICTVDAGTVTSAPATVCRP
jgi:hypothetical protein